MSYKVVINCCYGGFGLSEEAFNRYRELTGLKPDYDHEIKRHDPALVKIVEDMGQAASDSYSRLCVVEIDSKLYRINEYDGLESVITPDQQLWYDVTEC